MDHGSKLRQHVLGEDVSLLCRVVYGVEHEHVQVLFYHVSKLFNHLLTGPYTATRSASSELW